MMEQKTRVNDRRRKERAPSLIVRGFLVICALSSILIAVCWAQTNKANTTTAQHPNDKARLRRWSALPGYRAAEDARLDAKTGLPTSIVHKASGIVLVLIPAGEFQMGSPENEVGRGTREHRHRRVIRQPFYLGETEVTVGQFRKFVQAARYQTDAERGTPEGGHGKGAFATVAAGDREWSAAASWRNPFPHLSDYRQRDDYPVVQVSWNDAQAFCAHFGFQLPSEAQWEYAYRAGSCERFPWGDAEAGGKGHGNLADLTYKKRFSIANLWFDFDDGTALIAPVGRYQPNAWMLRDMVGNVHEWCQDALHQYPGDGADESAVQGDSRSTRVMRGGIWLGTPEQSRAAARFFFAPQGRRDFIGFRVARSTEP
jgi:formylglycine-generating enzyme required for sulfatase activity